MKPALLGAALASLAFAAIAGWAADAYWHGEAARRALTDAGYGEFVFAGAAGPPCPPGSATTAFIAQGGRRGGETQGYVCTSHFRGAKIVERPLDPADRLDWD